MELQHFPIKLSVNRERGVMQICQLKPDGTTSQIYIHKDQAIQIADFLIKEFSRRGKGVPEGADASFEKFWSAYPVKTAKQGALTAWKKSHADKHIDRILKHIESMKQSDQWKKGFIPHPSTYLNQRRYEDQIRPQENPWDNAV
jgi:hypothetical protein